MALATSGLMSEDPVMTAGFSEGFRQGFESAALKPIGDLGANPAAVGAPGLIRATIGMHARSVLGGTGMRAATGPMTWRTSTYGKSAARNAETPTAPRRTRALKSSSCGALPGKHRAKHVADKHFHAFSGRIST